LVCYKKYFSIVTGEILVKSLEKINIFLFIGTNIFDSYQLIDGSIATSSCVRRSYLGPKSLRFRFSDWNLESVKRTSPGYVDFWSRSVKASPTHLIRTTKLYSDNLTPCKSPAVRPRTKRSWRVGPRAS